jgi:hypothetical protein
MQLEQLLVHFKSKQSSSGNILNAKKSSGRLLNNIARAAKMCQTGTEQIGV